MFGKIIGPLTYHADTWRTTGDRQTILGDHSPVGKRRSQKRLVTLFPVCSFSYRSRLLSAMSDISENASTFRSVTYLRSISLKHEMEIDAEEPNDYALSS